MQRMAMPLGSAGGFSAIIDARSENEYALDHLPGAINWPSLNNEERIRIGTMYKQVSALKLKNMVQRWSRPTSHVTYNAKCWTCPNIGNRSFTAGGVANAAVHCRWCWDKLVSKCI